MLLYILYNISLSHIVTNHTSLSAVYLDTVSKCGI